jgi:competence protein ComEA
MEELRSVAARLRDVVDAAGVAPSHVMALLVIASCACAGMVALWWTAQPTPVAAPAPVPSAVAGTGPTPVAEAPSAGPVVVHVSGAVVSEGVIELPAGARVIDAVEAAGGSRRGARTDQLNLARIVRDGEQIHVPPRGAPQVAVPATGGDAGAAVAGTTGAPGALPAGVLNLNTASVVELETLPDVGPVLAGRIVAHRDSIGGFTTVEQLLEVDGIGDKTFATLRELVTV